MQVPIKDQKNPGRVTFESQPMLWPHEIFDYLFNDLGFTVSLEERKSYWEEAKSSGEPWAVRNPASVAHHPCGIYGDSARLPTSYTQEKVTGIFLNLVLFRPRSIRCSRFLLWSCDTKKLFRNRTTNQILRYIVWSFQFAFIGKHPTHTMGGRPLDTPKAGTPLTPANDCFCITENRGDWEWHLLLWRFNASWKGNEICYRCPAVCTGPVGMCYCTTNEDADWLHQEFGTSQFLARRLKSRNLCNSGLTQHLF